jgi:transposase-like protein
VAFALQFGIPVISLKSWDIPGVIKVNTVEEAVKKVKEIFPARAGSRKMREKGAVDESSSRVRRQQELLWRGAK